MSSTVRRSVLCIASVGVAALAACSDSTSPAARHPALSSVATSANPYNVLSSVISFSVVGTDSVRAVYSSPVDPGGATPWQRVTGATGRVVTLGLLPNANYTEILQAAGRHEMVAETLHVTTADLPRYVKTATLTVNGSPFGPGYTLVSPIAYLTDTVLAVAFDSIGRIRWYRQFHGFASLDIKMQPNGHYTVCLTPSNTLGSSNNVCNYIEILPSGDSLATFVTPAGYAPDGHEMLLTGNSASDVETHMYGYDAPRVMDLTSLGGGPSDTVYGHTLFRQRADGVVLFSWDAWDHYTLADWIEPTCCQATDFDHPNSLDFDADSNYLMSFRHFGAVVKIDRVSGATIWQLGGLQNQFTFVNDPLGLFSGQHYVRMLPNGHLLLYDNGLRHTPPHTRAVEYALDVGAKTATMVWEYAPQPMLFTPYVGSAQRLSNGNTLVGFGSLGQIHEVDANATLLAEGQFNLNGSIMFYRALRLPSLYEYQTP